MSDSAILTSFTDGGATRLTASLRDYTGALVPPALIRLILLRPGESTSLIHETTTLGDECVAAITLDKAGTWKYRFESTGVPFAAYEGSFYVHQRLVPPPS